tara:strand:- start:2568 stop:2819 length:252 start_codon:yes stop_codon:yes gene_type:complete
LAISLLVLPSNFFDYGQSLCPSKSLLDLECLGCGITRGIQHLIHFDFKIAWEFNKLSYPVVIIGIYYWFKWLIEAYKKIHSKS